MFIDLVLVALLAQAGGAFLGLAAVFLLLRASARGERGGFFRQSVRLARRVAAAVVVFAVLMKVWNGGGRRIQSAEQALAARVSEAGQPQTECGRERQQCASAPT